MSDYVHDGNIAEYNLSIVVVSYNTVEMTKSCLKSIYDNLGSLSVQVIVVDNDSKDTSVEMIRSDFPQVNLIENKENLGFAAANNQGFKIASSELILLLNSDTVVLGSVISASVNYMYNNPDVGAFGCRVLNSDKSVQLTCSQFPTHLNLILILFGLDRLSYPKFFGKYQLKHWNRDSERDVDVISGCYLMTKQTILNQVGELDEDFFFFGEETEWCYRVKQAEWKVRFSPVGEIIHHGGGSAKKLKSKRNLMLTNALVRFHLKRSGTLAALLMYLILFTFNLSRAVFWRVMSLAIPRYTERADLFSGVIAGIANAWPKDASK